jgi:NAD(P)-dependent dehydrogenase (short-subunit alcohol dehydrogenase family)
MRALTPAVRSVRPRPVAVVTGASGGHGRALVGVLARRGYDIGLIARGRAGLDAAVCEARAAGARAVAVRADVAHWAQVDAAATEITESLGPIDVWINNAMTTVFAPVAEISPAEFRRATEVTYLGQVHGAMAALHRMRPRDRGTIVSVGSALAFRGIPMQSAYCASKFAVRGFFESLRSELLADGSGIRVVQIHMPAMNTPQFGWCRTRTRTHPMPVPPIYDPERCATVVVRALERGQRQKIYGVWNWLLVQMNAHVPGVGDHFMAATGRDSQLTDIPIPRDRPDGLEHPVDDDDDAGARGIFGDRATGMFDPGYLRELPTTAVNGARAAGARTAEIVRGRVRPDVLRRRPARSAAP